MSTAASEGAAPTISDSDFTEQILTRICDDMGMMLDRDMPFGEVATTRETSRLAGKGVIHISFKLGFSCKKSGKRGHGAMLVPLAEAIAMAGFLMMTPDGTIEQNRKLKAPDDSGKDAMMELSNLIGGGIDAVLRETHNSQWSVRSLGCQGVKAGVRPAFPYEEGDELITAVMETQIAEFKPFKLILMLPVLDMP